MNRSFVALSTLLLLFSCTETVHEKPSGIDQMREDILYLASDELEGRDTGTKGEAKAASYIAKRFEELGIPGGAGYGNYFQTFEFNGSPLLGENNKLFINGKPCPDSLFFPLNFSGSGYFSDMAPVDLGFGMHSPESGLEDYAGKTVAGRPVLMDISSPDGIHPHSAFLAQHDIRDRAEKAQEAGAKAVILYTKDKSLQAPSKTLTENVNELEIPVIFMTELPNGIKRISLDMKVERPRLQGKNILAYLEKKAAKTMIIGAHYDHLGYGGGGSLHRGEMAIHNGADDNASGVAAMLELAHDLRDSVLSYNVLFIGFSGEERGLLGSNHWVKNPTIPLTEIVYMLNMDMVGRIETAEHKLSVNGVGTSPSWDIIDELQVNGLNAVTTESGIGPSDHMSFYLADIPVLHFFSGTHEDYHKPSDDEELINYEGIMDIVAFMEQVIYEVDDDGEIAFTKTVEEKKAVAAFMVTLGIVPDYLYEDKGMRIDGVTGGRPADRAGVKKGDIVIGLGERNVNDIYAYIEALALYSTGQTTEVSVLREGEELTFSITFD